MGILKDKVDLELLINGNGVAENFKNNSLFFMNKYDKSDDDVLSIPIGKIQLGGFYFIQYMDDSNWMKWAPVFTVDFKKFSNMIVIFGVNFNFIPIEIRVGIFDKFITEQDFENNSLLAVDYKGMYDELRSIGFEHTITEFNTAQIKYVHKISMNMLPRFLYSQHPKNKYDPKALLHIWEVKISERNQRHDEMSKALIDDFYKIGDDVNEKYKVLKDHIDRLQSSVKKYGGR